MRQRGGLSVTPVPHSVRKPLIECDLCFKHPWVRVGEKPYCKKHGILIHRYAIQDAIDRWWKK